MDAKIETAITEQFDRVVVELSKLTPLISKLYNAPKDEPEKQRASISRDLLAHTTKTIPLEQQVLAPWTGE